MSMPEAKPIQYEYLDHTADVQLHAWGDTFPEAVSQLVRAFYGYHTEDVKLIDVDYSMDIAASGHDRESMIHTLLEECLYLFETDPFFIAKEVEIVDYKQAGNSIIIRGWGESFDKHKHPGGTAVKAITYSSMQIHDNIEGKVHIYVIVDI
uniref:Archease domain-containing protein n=1 Tax=Panagrellus redivivus TaxID=6233 RepID=A0A7E4ZUP3_PANRE